jgi:hypothetical protein
MDGPYGILPLPLPLDYNPLLCAFHIKEGEIKKYGE